MVIKKNVIRLFFFSITLLIFTSCVPSNPVNDFFGIEMHPLDEQGFEIVNYTIEEGINYKSSIMMNPNLFAWAEISLNEVKIIIQNKTEKAIPLNYNIDEYVIVTDEKSYYLSKGERSKYTSKRKIKPNSTFEIGLLMPENYLQTIAATNNYTDQSKMFKNFIRDYSKAGTKLNIVKENIKYILIKFGHSATIVLKAVPENKKLTK